MLHQDLSLAERVLRDLAHERHADDPHRLADAVRRSCSKFGREFTPTAVAKLEHYDGERPIFDLFNIDEEIAKALARRVDLKSGGYLIIDQTEALTTVDVNTGGFVGARNFDDTIFKTNLEAGAGDRAPAAAAQPRRHHHHRLHRHGARGAPGGGAGRAAQAARARPHARSR